jgi:hypothetical protein
LTRLAQPVKKRAAWTEDRRTTVTQRAQAPGILLAVAALALFGVAASAAELPTLKPKRVEAARKCNIDGMTGMTVPGSNLCVRIGGYISAGVAAGH